MQATNPTTKRSALLEAYTAKTPGSAGRYRRAQELFPSGVTHHARYLAPYPVFIERAAGAHKWDVDGNEYVDYFGGHGALLLGHAHPAVVDAVTKQLSRGSHFGAAHDLEVEWASLICEMVPCAQRVRFTASGTEATLLALRLARAFTGRPMFVRLAGHFHGWHDHVVSGGAPGAVTAPDGILPEIVEYAIVCPPDDMASIEELLETRRDIAAVIVEPTGASFGHVPLPSGALAKLREATRRHGVLLIFDEVITGFRCAPGGAQQALGIEPDMATLAKIVAGGYPGGALAGHADVMSLMDFRGFENPRVPHQGTFNGNPVAAAAGIATLKLVRDSDAIERANRAAEALRGELNRAIRIAGVPWCCYGDFSGFHIFANPDGEPLRPEDVQAGRVNWRQLKSMPAPLVHKIRTGFLCGGVDVCPWPGGWVSCMHGDSDIGRTAEAMSSLLNLLRQDDEFS